MDRYPKLFILFSLIYFGLGSILGIEMGLLGHQTLRFAHIHLNLLGFMAMMIYGVGYFILPRFNATTLRWPQWVAPQFWLANSGLIGMIVSNYWYYKSANQTAQVFFTLFSIMEGLSIIMFVVNLMTTIYFLPKLAVSSSPSGPEESKVQAEGYTDAHQEFEEELVETTTDSQALSQASLIDPDMPVGEIVEKWASTIPVLVEAGFQHLANPEARQMVKRVGVTLRMACERHGLELEKILSDLQETIKKGQPSGQQKPKPIKRAITAHEIIGDVLKKHPSTKEVFRKYYGEGCFTCPGQAMESVAQSAMMHNVELEKLLDELNLAARQTEKAAV